MPLTYTVIGCYRRLCSTVKQILHFVALSSAIEVEKSEREQIMQVSKVNMLDRFVLVTERKVSFDTDRVSHCVLMW